MLDFLRWNKVKLDAPPGSLVYVGEKRAFTPYLLHYAYSPESFVEKRLDTVDACPVKGEGVNFIVLVGIHDPEMVKRVGACMDIPALVLEDILNVGQRAKFNWIDGDAGFLVMKNTDVAESSVSREQISLFWRGDTVLAFLETDECLLDGVVARIKSGRGRIRHCDANYLVTAILDTLVDRHMAALIHLSDRAEELEESLSSSVSDDLLGRLYEIKRETILLRNDLVPVRDIFKALLREDSEMPDIVLAYLDDIAGHLDQTIEGATSLHDILKSMIDYQISLIGIRTNRVMQYLTVIATIFIPLTFIAGVYGMNFANMPELRWEYGYHVVMGVMAVIGVGMFWFFRSRKYF